MTLLAQPPGSQLPTMGVGGGGWGGVDGVKNTCKLVWKKGMA